MTGDDPWRNYVPWTLYLCGALYALLGVGSGLMLLGLGGAAALDDVGSGIIVWVNAVFLFVLCAGVAALNLAVGWGFGRGRRWAWFGAVIFGGIYAPSICLPFGAVLLYGCLNDRTRRAFLD